MLRVSARASGATAFSVDPRSASLVIPPLTKRKIYIRFRARHSGVFSGILTLSSNDPVRAKTRITLRGTAVS